MTEKFYAGIGSRETPAHIMQIMRNIGGRLLDEGWTLRSGGALGADSAFEEGHDLIARVNKWEPKKEIMLPWQRYNENQSELHPGKFPFVNRELALAAMVHPAWHKCSEGARKMHTRNVRIILGLPPVIEGVKFVVCWTRNGLRQGGTGQALRVIELLNKQLGAEQIEIFDLGACHSHEEITHLLHQLNEFQKRF